MDTNRREFLKTGLTTAAALSVVPACAGSAGSLRFPDQPQDPVDATVGWVRPTAHASLKEAVRAAVALGGGLQFIGEGDSVLLKPCVNSSNAYPATADPEVLLHLAMLVKERGGVPFIADRTMFLLATPDVFRKTGIRDAAEEAGIEAVPLEFHPFIPVHHPLADHWLGHRIPVYRPVLTADHIINVCTPRTHSLGDFTMSLKNYVGVVNGPARTGMHAGSGFKQRVAEIALVARPSLVFMDGREGFSNGGPDSGDLVKPDFMAVSTDPLAVDAVGIAHLRLAGTNQELSSRSIWEVPTMKRAAELGIGARSGQAIHFVGMTAEEELAIRDKLH